MNVHSLSHKRVECELNLSDVHCSALEKVELFNLSIMLQLLWPGGQKYDLLEKCFATVCALERTLCSWIEYASL